MKEQTKREFELLLERYPELEFCRVQLLRAYELLCETMQKNGTIFTCGNGGSAADSEHIVGELLKSFKIPRSIDDSLTAGLREQGSEGEKLAGVLEGGIRAVALTSHPAFSTAYSNDKEPQVVYAQQLSVLAERSDVLIAISTSGNSLNCVYAAVTAKAIGIPVIAMTGQKESRLSELADVCIRVPALQTYQIQEYHLPVYHALCAMLESEKYA